MQIAQQLYEGIELGSEGLTGLITYMRTDSVRIAPSAVQGARDYIREHYGERFLPMTPPLYKSREGAQEAHEAIRPTTFANAPDRIKDYLTRDQLLLYRLIWSRFLASQMKPALLKTTTIEIEAKRYLFKATGSILLFPGFMVVYRPDEQEERVVLPRLKEGDEALLLELIPKQHFTQPPPRYNEATLVKALEDKGIGRPSTYASILEIITDRRYVRREGRSLHPTELGMVVNELLVENFPRILDIGFTADLETRLDEIERGEVWWTDVLEDFWKEFERDFRMAVVSMRDVKREEEVITEEICELCGGRMVVKTSRYGTRFLGCENFPKCHFTRSIPLNVECPFEGCPGQIVPKTTKRGKIFYGCTRYPDCRFATWYEPVERRCPDCGGILVKKREDLLSCLSSECNYTESGEEVRG
jgi:DNA topoisomerase-1